MTKIKTLQKVNPYQKDMDFPSNYKWDNKLESVSRNSFALDTPDKYLSPRAYRVKQVGDFLRKRAEGYSLGLHESNKDSVIRKDKRDKMDCMAYRFRICADRAKSAEGILQELESPADDLEDMGYNCQSLSPSTYYRAIRLRSQQQHQCLHKEAASN